MKGQLVIPFTMGCCFLLGVSGMRLPVSANVSNSGTPPQALTRLESGKGYHGELKEGVTATYSVRLEKDSFLELRAVPKGFDIAIGVDGPDGKTLVDNDFERSRSGPETVALIAAETGEYRIRFFGKRADPGTGTFDVSGVAIRPATENDRLTARAETLFSESLRLAEQRKLEPAVLPAREGVALYEKVFGADDPRLVPRLTYLGVLSLQLADFPKAEADLTRALAISEKRIGPEAWESGWILNQLGTYFQTRGDYPKAEAAFQRALALFEKLGAPDQLDLAETLNNLGVFYSTIGDNRRVGPLYERAAAIKEKQLPPDHEDIGLGLNNLGMEYLWAGDLWNAEKSLSRALLIYEKRTGPDSAEVAAVMNNLALLYKTMGNYAKAEPLYARSLAIKEKQRGPVHPDVAIALNNLGLLYQAEGRYDEAVVSLQRASQIREKVLGPESPELGNTLNNLGFVFRLKKDYDQAETYCLRARAIFEKQLPADHPFIANALSHLGLIAMARGRYDEAEPLLRQAMASRKAILGASHPDYAGALFSLSTLAGLKGDIPGAAGFAEQANDAMERDFLRNLVGGSEQQKVLYLKRSASFLNMVVSLNLATAPGDTGAAAAALTAVLQRKGRALDMISRGIESLRARSAPEDRALLDSLALAQTRLANLVVRVPRPKDLQKYRDQVAALEREIGEIQERVSAQSGELRSRLQPVTLAAVQAVIPDDGALVEFALYAPFDARTNSFGAPHYAAFVLTREGNPKSIDLGEAAVINAAIEKFRKGFTIADAEAGKNVRPAARELDRLLMEPVRKLLGDRVNLLVSPDGVLNLVPFAALVDERNRYLVERFQITSLSSGRDLLRFHSRNESKSTPYVFADPDFGHEQKENPDRLGLLAGMTIPRLPETAAEADSIRRVFPDSKVLLREAATETAIKAVRHPRFLHIATHGFFFREDPESSSEASGTRNITHGPENDDLTWLKVNNPLVKSGLILAGVNRSADNRTDDGVFTALEAAGLDLSGTELVVLSACDSGIGEIRTGEGVYGLRRALVLAGSESQLMSLWRVSDRGTKELMADYYRRLKAGEGRAAALRGVQLSMLKNPRRAHPYFWASFIQSGEWKPLGPTAVAGVR